MSISLPHSEVLMVGVRHTLGYPSEVLEYIISKGDRCMDDFNKIIEEGLNAIDDEIQEEEDIREQAEYLTQQIIEKGSVRIKYENKQYESIEDRFEEYQLGIRSDKKYIVLIAYSLTKAEYVKKYNETAFAPKVYTPAMFTADNDPDYTFEQIVNTLVASFLAKLVGKFIVEELKDDDLEGDE